MNRTINFQHLGGLHVTQDTFDYLQTGNVGALDALAKIVGDKVILAGVADQGATSAEGWIAFNGEVLPFTGGLKAAYIIVEEIVQDEQYDDNQQRPVYYTRRLKYGNVIPPAGGFPAAELTRLPFSAVTLKDSLLNIERLLKSTLNLEPEVIMEGCTVDDSVPGNVAITTGLVMFNGKLVVSQAYNGATPAYLSEAGTWSTAVPAGLYIKFDPHTSQRYKDVRYRDNHRSGEIIYCTVLSDRFDIDTGLGKWEWLGFKLSSTVKGKVGVGLWFGPNGPEYEYDEAYRGILNPGGGKSVTLEQKHLPSIDLLTETFGDNGWPDGSNGRNNSSGNEYVLAPQAGNKRAKKFKVPLGGEDEPLDIRQRFVVLAAIERI